MSILSRILWGLISLSLIALVTVIFLVPDAIINFLNTLDSIHVVVRFVIVILVYLMVLGIFLWQMRQNNAVGEDYLIVNATGAVASITLDSVRERIQRVIESISDVDNANVHVESINGKCAVTLDVHASEDINVPEKHKEIARAIEQVVKKQLGLKIARQPRVSLHLGSEKLPGTPASQRKPDPTTETKSPRRFAGIFPMGGNQHDDDVKPETPVKQDLFKEETPPKTDSDPVKVPSDIDKLENDHSLDDEDDAAVHSDDIPDQDDTLPKF